MELTDTHTHLYLPEFDNDRPSVVERALDNNVKYMLLPNIDSTTVDSMLHLCRDYPDHIFPMIGLHPTSVKENYKEELGILGQSLSGYEFIAIGETGMDLYWDTSLEKEQEIAFRQQINLALDHDLPIVIHQRNSYNEIVDVLRSIDRKGLKGVFHCFSGTIDQANEVIDLGFMLGIGGVLTFKNSKLFQVVEQIDLKHIILETDAPFLTPHPFRGKRNESSYTSLVAERLAEIKKKSTNEIAEITTANADQLFRFKNY